MKTATIGFLRDDGDLQVLATLNNNDELLSSAEFRLLVTSVQYGIAKCAPDYEVIVVERQDAPDYVEVTA